MSKEALKLALEALENAWLDASMGKGDVARHTEAITALRQAIEQAEQVEPVAWFRYESVYEYRNQLARCTPKCIGAFPVYTAPPPRQPLTDERILHFVEIYVGAPSMAYPLDNSDWIQFARAIEAAHHIGVKK